MNRDELVGYIQGLIDMSKETDEMLELKLLELINKALSKHRASQIKGGEEFFNNAEHYANLRNTQLKGNWCDPNPTNEK